MFTGNANKGFGFGSTAGSGNCKFAIFVSYDWDGFVRNHQYYLPFFPRVFFSLVKVLLLPITNESFRSQHFIKKVFPI